jgi:hypothetical protein
VFSGRHKIVFFLSSSCRFAPIRRRHRFRSPERRQARSSNMRSMRLDQWRSKTNIDRQRSIRRRPLVRRSNRRALPFKRKSLTSNQCEMKRLMRFGHLSSRGNSNYRHTLRLSSSPADFVRGKRYELRLTDVAALRICAIGDARYTGILRKGAE